MARPKREINVNELIGRRLRSKLALDQRSGTEFGKDLAKYLGSAWNAQSVSEALAGDRAFRAGDLIALALAADVPVLYLLDARSEHVDRVSLVRDGPSISAADLLRAFGGRPLAPEAVQAIHARAYLRQVLDAVAIAGSSAKTVDRFLRLIESTGTTRKGKRR